MIRLPEPLLDWTGVVGCYVLPGAAFEPYVVGHPRIVTRVSGKRLYVRRVDSNGSVVRDDQPDEYIMSKSVEVICDTWIETQQVRSVNVLAGELHKKRCEQYSADMVIIRDRLMGMLTPKEAS